MKKMDTPREKIYSESSSSLNLVYITLTAEGTPIPYNRKLQRLIEDGFSLTDAIEEMKRPIEVEVYFDSVASSVFLLETEAMNNVEEAFNPYQGNRMICDELLTYHTFELIESILVANLGYDGRLEVTIPIDFSDSQFQKYITAIYPTKIEFHSHNIETDEKSICEMNIYKVPNGLEDEILEYINSKFDEENNKKFYYDLHVDVHGNGQGYSIGMVSDSRKTQEELIKEALENGKFECDSDQHNVDYCEEMDELEYNMAFSKN